MKIPALVVVLVAVLMGCDSTSVELPVPDDMGTAMQTDAGLRSWEIKVLRTDREPAAGALVYQLDSLQGRLLGRADDFGVFRHQGPFTDLLVRQGFDQASEVSISSPRRDVRLKLVKTQPELLRLRNVGLEHQLTEGDGDIDAVVAFNEELLALRNVLGTEVRLVRVDPETGREESIYEVVESEGVSADFFEFFPQVLAIRFTLRASDTSSSRNWFVVYGGSGEPVSGPSAHWNALGLAEAQAVDAEGRFVWIAPGPSVIQPRLTATKLARSGETTRDEFDLPDSVACIAETKDVSSQVFMRVGDRAWRYDATTSTLTPASSFAVLGRDCRNTWVANDMLMSLDFEGRQVAIHGRERTLVDATWTQLTPRGARLQQLVPIDEHRAFVTARPDDRREDRLIYLDTERDLFVDFSEQLGFASVEIESTPELIEGRWSVRLVGGASNYDRDASINEDGTDPRIDRLGLRSGDNPPCPPLLSRGVPVLSERWGICRDRIHDVSNRVVRTFFEVDFSGAFDIAFIGHRLVYRAGVNQLIDTELFVLDTNAEP